ncbi:protein neprosin-like [Typha latifolia]|uniref:protein neprosin-like n=1 Tax=Typha latifolia TaxID=4733 RepID=UPI003C2DC4EE
MQYAIYQTYEGDYHGTTAKISVYGAPDLKPHQRTAAVVWLFNEDGADNAIQTGVHADGYKSTGCYNLRCPGFVTVNSSELKPGAPMSPTSVYDGEQRYITLTMKMDEKTGDWSLYREDIEKGELVGFWPKTLFTSLAKTVKLALQWEVGIFLLNGKEKQHALRTSDYLMETVLLSILWMALQILLPTKKTATRFLPLKIRVNKGRMMDICSIMVDRVVVIDIIIYLLINEAFDLEFLKNNCLFL